MEGKNKIAAIVIVTLSLVMIAGLFFLLFSSVKTIISEFETFTEVFEDSTTDETGANSGDSSNVGSSGGNNSSGNNSSGGNFSEEDFGPDDNDFGSGGNNSSGNNSSGDNPSGDDTGLVTITLEIKYVSLNEDHTKYSYEPYTDLKYVYSVGSEYNIDIPDYSSQGYFPENSCQVSGIALEDETFTIVYTKYKYFQDISITDSNEVPVVLHLSSGNIWNEHEYIRFINTTDENITELTFNFYDVQVIFDPLTGKYIDKHEFVCTFVLRNIDVDPGESIVWIRNYHLNNDYYNIGLLVKYNGMEYAHYSEPNTLKEIVNYYYDWIEKKYGG